MLLFRLFILIFVSSLLLGCVSLGEYAVKYRASPQEGAGVSPSATLLKEGRKALSSVAEQESQNIIKEQLQCEYFRNQLVVAAEEAQAHRLGVWLYPWYWPLHLLTFFILPVEETQKANLVVAAAQEMELAYQNSDTEFLTVCRRQLKKDPLGTAFERENPFVGDKWKKLEKKYRNKTKPKRVK